MVRIMKIIDYRATTAILLFLLALLFSLPNLVIAMDTWAFGQCGNLKIDTHRDNVVMQNMLKKNGFQSCGIIHVQDGSERLAYQKTK